MRQLVLLRERKYAGRKTARPISTREFNHVILKARRPVLRRHAALVKRVLHETQLRYGMRLRAIAIMEDHVHLIARVPSRAAFADSMRFLASRIAMGIGRGKLWRQRVWSRVVRVGRDLAAADRYVWNNPFRRGIFGRIDTVALFNGVLWDPDGT